MRDTLFDLSNTQVTESERSEFRGQCFSGGLNRGFALLSFSGLRLGRLLLLLLLFLFFNGSGFLDRGCLLLDGAEAHAVSSVHRFKRTLGVVFA
jgi:hypothetical protein